MATRACSSCNETLPKSEYSKNQWSKNPSVAKCKYCIAAGGPPSHWPAAAKAEEAEAKEQAAPSRGDAGAADAAQGEQGRIKDEQDKLSKDGAEGDQKERRGSGWAWNSGTWLKSPSKSEKEGDDDESSSSNSNSGGDANSLESFDTAQEDSQLTEAPSNLIGAVDGTGQVTSSTAAIATSDAIDEKGEENEEEDSVEKGEEEGESMLTVGTAYIGAVDATTATITAAMSEENIKIRKVDMPDNLSASQTERYFRGSMSPRRGSLTSQPIPEERVSSDEGELTASMIKRRATCDQSTAGSLANSFVDIDMPDMLEGGETAEDYLAARWELANEELYGNVYNLSNKVSGDLGESFMTLNSVAREVERDNVNEGYGADNDVSGSSTSGSGSALQQQQQELLTATHRGSMASSTSEASLPSYQFEPTVAEKSDRIMRSYRPSSSSRFRGSSLLTTFRRFRSSNAAASSQAGGGASEVPPSQSGASSGLQGGAVTSTNNLPSSQDNFQGRIAKSVTHTDVTESDDEEEARGSTSKVSNSPSISLGSLLKDTYSFIYVYPTCSAPFFYALFLFAFQSLVYALLLSSLIDVTNTGNVLHVPPQASLTMRIGQGCAILIAVVNSVDVMVALNNLLRTPDSIVVIDGEETQGFLSKSSSNANNSSTELSSIQHGIAHARSNISSGVASGVTRGLGGRQTFPAGLRFKFANILRLIEGCLAVTATFILIVRSDDIIELFINFAALEFVVNLDNLAFALAEHGLISDRLQVAARFVGGLGFCYHDHHRAKKRARGRAFTNANHLAQLKGSCISHLFCSPVHSMKSHPDTTRRFTLFIMALTLFGWWGFILSGLNNGDFLCKSLDVEFFHAHVAASNQQEAEEGIKPFLSSRSGTYVAMFMEDEDQPFLETFTNIIFGKSNLFIAYRKADPKIETPQNEMALLPLGRIPQGYEEVVYYDPSLKHWVFTSCDLSLDFLRDRVCAGPQVHSVETDSIDLSALSTSAFHVVDENPDATTMALPATIECTECGRQESGGSAGGLRMAAATCGLSGGECSEPLEDFGFGRQCICPEGQYGVFCDDHYGSSCPTLEIIVMDGVDEPPGAGHFLPWETRGFTLRSNQRGLGNTPVWERTYGSKGITDRLEFRGGTHWAITRTQRLLKISHTIAIAEGHIGGVSGDISSALNTGVGLNVQPEPAGLTFHLPKSAAWGTQPDFFRPFSSYKFQCKPAPLVSAQLGPTP